MVQGDDEVTTSSMKLNSKVMRVELGVLKREKEKFYISCDKHIISFIFVNYLDFKLRVLDKQLMDFCQIKNEESRA